MSDISDAELRCRLELKLKNLVKARNVRKQKIVQTKRFQSKPKPVAPKSPSVCNVYDMQCLPDFCVVVKYGGRKALVNVKVCRIAYNVVVNLISVMEILKEMCFTKH